VREQSQVTDPITIALSRGSNRSSAAWADVLGTVPLFAGLSQRHLRRIADKATMKRFAPLTSIVRAGDAGDAFFVILDGTAAVRRPGKRNVKLKAGDLFGELALLDASPRTATVEAEGEVLTMRLGRAAFQKVLEGEPKVAVAMLKTLAARMRESSPSGID
jgi:CRP-like cAMP-binding protein